jgi:hypothetical protein
MIGVVAALINGIDLVVALIVDVFILFVIAILVDTEFILLFVVDLTVIYVIIFLFLYFFYEVPAKTDTLSTC